MIEPFHEIVLIGSLSPEVLGKVHAPLRRVIGVPARVDSLGRLPVRRLVREGRKARRNPGPTLVVTDLELALPGLQALFGFAHGPAKVAVVSTAGLQDAANPERVSRRLRNVAAHEGGHLAGLAHCTEPRCVMKAVADLQELDARADQPCGSCPTRGSVRRWLKGLATFLGSAP